MRHHSHEIEYGTNYALGRKSCSIVSTGWRGALLFTGASLLALSVPAAAQEAATGSAEQADDSTSQEEGAIIVTARRRNETVQDIPLSINAFGSEALDNFGVDESRDVAKLVSGVDWKAGSSTARNNVFVRGVGNASVAYSSSPAVGLYLDDTYLNAQSLAGFSTFDIARVEVLKGPQGTLYGRNTTGGAIKFVPNKPKVGDPLSAEASVDVGNYYYVRAEAAISVPLGDVAALRVAVNTANRGGMFRDSVNRDLLVDRDVKAIRATLVVEPTDQFSIQLMGTYGRSISDNKRYKRIDYADPSTIQFDPVIGPFYTGICANPGIGTAPGCTNLFVAVGLDDPDLNPSETAVQSGLRRGDSPERNEVYGGQLTLNYDFGPASLTSVTSYFHNDVLDTQDVSGSAQNLLVLQDSAKPRQFSQEVRLASNGDPDFRYLVGAYYFRERLAATAPVSITGFGVGFGAEYGQVTETKAAFAEGSYRVTPELDVTVGLRYSDDKKNVDFRHYFFTPDGRPVVGFGDVLELGLIPDFAVNDVVDGSNSLSGRVSISYTIAKDVLLYASANRGFKGAEFNVGADLVQTATFVEPETVDAFELGLKSQFLDGAVTFNLAGYYYNYKDKQETIFDSGVARLANAQARVYGLDAEIGVKPVEGLTLSGNISLLDAKYKRFANCTPAGADCSGNRLPNAPKFSAHIVTSYSIPVGDRSITIQGDASYRTKTEFSPLNLAYLQQDDYWLFGARVTAELNDSLELGAWIKNIANKAYFQDMFAVSSIGYSIGLPGDKRTYGVTLRGKF